MGSVALILALVIFSHFHWAAGLVGFSIWLFWRVLSTRELPVPGSWPGWLIAAGALLVSTILATRPSGLEWAGFLQWASVGLAVYALSDHLRQQPKGLDVVWWGLLATGLCDGFLWTRDLWISHQQWWAVRTEGLPLFPFRIRLFGSHGATQAAAWLSVLLVLGAVWGLPRLRQGLPRLAGMGMLLWWALLLGMCDSRLALGGLILVAFYTTWKSGVRLLLPCLIALPMALWITRDYLHPSRVASGGGFDQAPLLLSGLLASVCLGALLHRFASLERMGAVLRWRLAWTIAVLPIVPLALAMVRSNELERWSTGRLSFWGAGLQAWSESPLLGVGPWGFVWEYATRVGWGYRFLAMHPHNLFLEVVLAGGCLFLLGVGWSLLESFLSARSGVAPGLPLEFFPLVLLIFSAMSFDSPLSSPQIQTVSVVLLAVLLRFSIASRWVRDVPRSLVLLPALILVPTSFLVERQIDKTSLVQAGELSRSGKWEQGAQLVVDRSRSALPDPQGLRNVLIARTYLGADDPDSLRILLPQWDSLLGLEPKFLPNRIHRDWVAWKLQPDSTNSARVVEGLRLLWLNDQPEPPLGTIQERWRSTSYPSDDPGFWIQRRKQAGSNADSSSVARWIDQWLKFRFPSGGLNGLTLGLPASSLVVRPSQEVYLYGSPGTRWLVLPQVIDFGNLRN